MKIRQIVRYYFARGIQSKIEEQADRAGVAVSHRRGRKIIEMHALDETCDECAQLSQKPQKSASLRSFVPDSR